MLLKTKILMQFLSSPRIVFYLFPWLLCILVLGTISQRYIGLYQSEQIFFSSFILWFGYVPLPGMYSILTLLTVALTAKLILKSPWTRQTSGTVITHMGALLLLLGGLLTAVTSEEGSIVLGKGETTDVVQDYHQRELAIQKNGKDLFVIPREDVAEQQVITHDGVPFNIIIKDMCYHCEARQQTLEDENFQDIAKKIRLVKAPLKKEDEENRFGMVLSISQSGSEQDGVYVALEGTAAIPKIIINDDTYSIIARKNQRELPFSVRLDQFQKYAYPGTEMAQEYESVVTVTDGELSWQSPIRMNEPLRYKGYTLYQSSFIQAAGEEYSVLAVVKNAGRVFPYISSIIMCIGLLIHIYMRRRKVVS